MEELEVFYKDYEAQVASTKKRLSVVISADSLSSFVHSPDKVFFVERSTDFESIKESRNYIDSLARYYNVQSSKFYIDSPQFSIIPEELTEIHQLRSQLAISFKVDDYDEIGITSIGSMNICFVKKSRLSEALSPKLSIEQQEHFISKFIRSSSFGNDICHCCFLRNSFYVYLTNDMKVIIATRYQFDHQNDVLYHLQMIHNHIQTISRIHLSGFISEESKIVKLLKSYFSEVKLQYSEFKDRFNFILS